jgi:hypothetical protein
VGTSTGNPSKPPDEIPVNSETGTSASCDAKTTKLSDLNAASPLGFSAADVLALATANAETTIEWSNRGVTFGPESGTGTLTIEVEARDTQPRFIDREPKASGGNTGGAEIATIGNVGTVCADTVELDVSLHIVSGGGALDERIDTVLTAKNPDVARIYVTRKAADLTGSFDASLSDSKAALESIQLSISFSELGSSGELGAGFVQPAPANGSSSGVTSSAVNPGPIAHWPAGPACEDRGFSARVDQRVHEFSLQDGIDQLDAAMLVLNAPGAAPTALHASFEPSGRACAQLESSIYGGTYDPIPNISAGGTLALRSDDGRIDGKWPMKLRAGAAADGGLGEVLVAFDLHGSIIASIVDAADFEETYGFHGIDLSSYDQASIVLTLRVGASTSPGGEVTINGITRPACQTQPAQPLPSSDPKAQGVAAPGCAGLDFKPIWMATITPKS